LALDGRGGASGERGSSGEDLSLLETTALAVERIAWEVGFGSSTVLRDHFARVVGTNPTTYRRAFRKADRPRAA